MKLGHFEFPLVLAVFFQRVVQFVESVVWSDQWRVCTAGRRAVFWADTEQLPADTLAAWSRLLRYLWCSSTQSLPVCDRIVVLSIYLSI